MGGAGRVVLGGWLRSCGTRRLREGINGQLQVGVGMGGCGRSGGGMWGCDPSADRVLPANRQLCSSSRALTTMLRTSCTARSPQHVIPQPLSVLPHAARPPPCRCIRRPPPPQGVHLNGPSDLAQRYPGNVNLSFAYVEGESLLMGLKVREQQTKFTSVHVGLGAYWDSSWDHVCIGPAIC